MKDSKEEKKVTFKDWRNILQCVFLLTHKYFKTLRGNVICVYCAILY